MRLQFVAGRRGAVLADPSSGYDIDAVLAAIRADTSDGIDYTASATNAPNGLVRPTVPTLSSPTVSTVSSIANLKTAVANGQSNRIVTLQSGSYSTGTAITIGGQDIRIIINDTTWTPDRDECAFVITDTARRIEIIGNNSIWANGFYAQGAEDIFMSGLTLIGQSEGTTNPIRSFPDETANAVAVYGHRIMASHCYFRQSGGTWFSGETPTNDDSTNLILINSIAYAPVSANAVGWRSGDGTLSGTTYHENPSRFNRTNYWAVIDCRAYAQLKHCLRAHNGSGKGVWIRNQLERGGWYTVPTPPGSSSTTAIRLRKNNHYRPADAVSGGGLNIEYGGTPVVNTMLSLKNTIYYGDDAGSPGSALLPTGTGAPHSSWTTCADSTASLASGNSYQAYIAAPAWDFLTSTPTY